MSEVLDIDEINRRFASQWVLIDEPEVDEHLNVIRGKVVFHTKDRDELDRKMLRLKLKRGARFYTGPFPPDIDLVL